MKVSPMSLPRGGSHCSITTRAASLATTCALTRLCMTLQNQSCSESHLCLSPPSFTAVSGSSCYKNKSDLA